MSGTGKQVSGAFEYFKGKLQRAIGGKTGNRSMQARGLGNQAKGGATYETGKTENKAKDILGE